MASIPSLTNNVKRWIFTFGASQIWAKLPPLIWISSVAPENSLLSSTFLFATFWWHLINHGPPEILYYWALCDWLTTIFWCHSYHGPGSLLSQSECSGQLKRDHVTRVPCRSCWGCDSCWTPSRGLCTCASGEKWRPTPEVKSKYVGHIVEIFLK